MIVAKRGKKKELTFVEEFRKTPTPVPTVDLDAKPTEELAAEEEHPGGNDKEPPPAAHVNDAYDAMPNEIEDAGAVFKMAFLDAERGRLHTQALLVKQEGEANIKAMHIQYQNAVNALQMQIKVADQRLREHKEYIEQKHGIALRSYTYDDETGVLKKQIQTEPEPEPAGGK